MESLGRKLALVNWIVMGAGIVVGTGLLIIYGRRLPPQVPLWYSRPWGEEQLAHPGWLWVGVGLILVCGITSGIYSKRGVLSDLVTASSIVTQILMAMAMFRIVMLVV